MEIRACKSSLEREQAFDVRRSVLCGELHLNREAARDEEDESAYLALAWMGEKPVGTGRLLQRGQFWQMEHLSVLPEQRRHGVGKALAEHFMGEAAARGSREVIAVSPIATQAFFVRLGFVLATSEGDVSVLKRPIG